MGSDNQFQKKKMRTAQELLRQKAKRSPYESVQIICEGQTEYVYFKFLINFFRLNTANVSVVTGSGSAPVSIVEEGFDLAKNIPDIDRVVFVFDRDDHESYERAINMVNTHRAGSKDKSKPKYEVITSTPCFEIWLLLHFKCTTKAYNKSGSKTAADILISDLRQHIASYQKTNVSHWIEQLIHRTEAAIKNAQLLQEHNKKTNSINPSTNVHVLIELFKALK